MKRKICVITGSRAEYGLLRPLIEEICGDLDLRLQLLVTGMHLSPEFGLTYREIEKDGFKIDAKIDIQLNSDASVGISKSMGLAMVGFARLYERLNPDLIVVLGDRFEIFSAASAALISRRPIAHLYGGEVTLGSFDDSFRHSVTKMSNLHFTSTEEYRKRVIQLGENPARVFNVGAIGLDNIKRLNFLSKQELERELRFKFNKRNLLVTFHPVTLEDDSVSQSQFKNLLDALNDLEDTNVIFTKANADPGGRLINALMDSYTKRSKCRAVTFASLGQIKYLSTMQYVDAMVGNSSSGIMEAPSFKIGTINIGDRQQGRIRTGTTIDCRPTKEAIKSAIKRLYSKEFQRKLKTAKNPYGEGKAAKKIKKILKNYDLRNIIKKVFYDIDF